MRRRFDSFIKMRIDFEGHLDEGLLAEAVERSCVTLPLIACRFNTDPWVWRRWVPRREASREILRVVEAPGCLEEEVHRAFGEIIDIEQGPQLHLVLIRDEQRDSLCILINHMVCDAVGLKTYIGVLASLYSRLAEGLDPVPPPFCSKRSIWPVVRGFTLREFLQAARTKPRDLDGKDEEATEEDESAAGEPTADEPSQEDSPPPDENPFEIVTASLSAEDFARIRATAKARGLTVNDAFLGALGFAWHRATGSDVVILPCSLDMRRFAPPRARIGITNLASTCICYAEIPPEGTMEDVLMQVVNEMRVYKGGVPGLYQFLRWLFFSKITSLAKMDSDVFDTFSKYDTLSSSNMGTISEECVSFATVPVRAACLLLPTIPAPAFSIGVSTFRDIPTFSLCVKGDDEGRASIKNVFALLMEELASFELTEDKLG
jgi:NRPS condensation-like uncharacterized protein